MNVRLVDYKVTESVVGTIVDQIPDGVKDIYASDMWEKNYTGNDVVVAILDTGCYPHIDLQGQIIGGKNFTTDYNSDPTNINDNVFHGTHVAGTIAAIRGNSQGVVGVAPNVKLLILKVLDSSGSGGVYNIINAIDYAINWRGPQGQKVRIMNMSFGTPSAPSLFYDAIKRADKAGISIVCASGNSGDGNEITEEVNYPAYYPECIAVGAYDLNGNIAYFSNSNNQIDLAAPGVNIYSTDNSGSYMYSSGTSMAAPHVSGALALIANKLDKAFGRTATSAELYNELINNTTMYLDNVSKTKQGFGSLRFVNVDQITTNKYKVSDINFEDVLKWCVENKMFNTPEYWRNNAVAGKTVRGEYMREALIKIYIVQGLKGEVEQ